MIDLYQMQQDSPRNYGVPHNTWRPNQYSMYKQISEISQNGGGFAIAEMGTGSGKSAIAAAMGHDDKVLVICHSLALLDQYASLYDFSIVKGRQEYKCAHEEKVHSWQKLYKLTPTATDCTFSPMHKCPYASECSYLTAKHTALAARRAACTYRYIGVSRAMKEREGNIVLDEAHDAAEELIRFNEFVYTNHVLQKYNLPIFPITTYGPEGKGAILTDRSKGQISSWLTACAIRLYIPDDDIEGKAATKQRQVHDRFQRMQENLYSVDWFLQLQKGQISFKALDAKSVAKQVFQHKSTKLLMSATIGNPEPLADALGIDNYKFLTFDHPVPPKYRSIKNLNQERMTRQNLKIDPMLYKEQAMAIWNWIMKMPPSWRGIILTTSYKKIEQLYKHLIVPSTIVPHKRRIISQEKGQKVSTLVQNFLTDVEPGDIMIGTIQGWGSGLDLRGELARFVVIAGVPHVNPTDEYAKARRKLAGGIAYQNWIVFNAVMQACGRVSRGTVDESGDWLPNYAALADGSATTKTAQKYYGSWFRNAFI